MTGMATTEIRHVFLRGFELPARIGVYAEEHAAPQRITVDVDLEVRETGEASRARGEEDLADVVDYGQIVVLIRQAVGDAHIMLVETLAERIAGLCLGLDSRVLSARVRVGKPDIFPDIALAGVEILRRRAI